MRRRICMCFTKCDKGETNNIRKSEKEKQQQFWKKENSSHFSTNIIEEMNSNGHQRYHWNIMKSFKGESSERPALWVQGGLEDHSRGSGAFMYVWRLENLWPYSYGDYLLKHVYQMQRWHRYFRKMSRNYLVPLPEWRRGSSMRIGSRGRSRRRERVFAAACARRRAGMLYCI